MIKTSSAEILIEIPAGDNSHYDAFNRDVISQSERMRDKQLAVMEYQFKDFDLDNDDNLLELEFEFNE
ncbi:MAG: hypothetical protein ABI954_06235 [Pyrinomonadaceae bacterium]